MREIRQSGSEGGEPQLNAASLPLSFGTSLMADGTTERACYFWHKLDGGRHGGACLLLLAQA